MKSLLKIWRDRKERLLEKEREEIARMEEENRKRLQDKTAEMLSKPCPFMGSGELCSNKCVHFKPGHSFIMDYYDGGRAPVVVGPSCKLWTNHM